MKELDESKTQKYKYQILNALSGIEINYTVVTKSYEFQSCAHTV